MSDPSALVGIGFRTPHAAALIDGRPDVGWLELHSENYMVEGGPRRWVLTELARHYPISLHGVGLSLGSPAPPDRQHLRELRALIEDVRPTLVSEHLAWSRIDGYFLADLLPVPLTHEAIEIVVRNIDIVQQCLGRSILVENISAYGELQPPEMSEARFLNLVMDRANCGLVLDVSNLLVNARNLGRSADALLSEIEGARIGEIHLGGHEADDQGYLLDRHATAIGEASWRLFDKVLTRFGPRPTVIEWDQEIPAFETLLSEADKLRGRLMDAARAPAPLCAAV